MLLGVSLALLLVLFLPWPLDAAPPTRHEVHIDARMFAFAPARLNVQLGDEVTLILHATDVVHGLILDGYEVRLEAAPGHSAQATFVADRPGKFRYRCSITCGSLHPFMIGELVVGPNILGFIGINLAITPGLFFGASWLGRRLARLSAVPARQLAIDLAYALVPFGLMAWIAFSLSFVLANFSYVWPVLSDPFGWGWNLLGTRDWPWTPYLPAMIPFLQAPVLLIGLAAAVVVAWRIAGEYAADAKQTALAVVPIALLLFAFTLGFLRLYLG